MGTIVKRTRRNGSASYLAKIIITRSGAVVHRESRTFDRKTEAAGWIGRREEELSVPGAIERAKIGTKTLADAVERYENEAGQISPTKAICLRSIREHKIGSLRCEDVRSHHIVEYASELLPGRKPQTVRTYLAYMSTVFSIAGPAWGYPLDQAEIRSAMTVAARLGVIKQSDKRDRRPTLDELDAILKHTMRDNGNMTLPMTHIIAFALFSTRRREEVTRIQWDDLDEANSRILVRDMKDPERKKGNDVWCNLPEPAMAIIKAMPRLNARIFPHSHHAITSAFRDTCAAVKVDDLRLHDLRHEGISRLFEIGLDIPRVAAVSGHKSWGTLQRYTHIRQSGDKYAGWKWLDVVTQPPPARRLRRVLCSA